MGVAVRITLGRPPRWFRHPHEEVRLLAPPPAVFKLKDDREFEEAYGQHLETVGVERLMRRFQDLSERHEGRTLVLCCFESRVEDCHRGQFATFWESRTGQRVPELDCDQPHNRQKPAQGTLW